MNRFFRTVWDSARCIWIVAQENATARGKKGGVSAQRKTGVVKAVSFAVRIGMGIMTSHPAFASGVCVKDSRGFTDYTSTGAITNCQDWGLGPFDITNENDYVTIGDDGSAGMMFSNGQIQIALKNGDSSSYGKLTFSLDSQYVQGIKVTGIAPGELTGSSFDAVNGMQLFGVAGSTASALGGGSTVNADGTMQAPAYAIGGSTFNNVGDSLTNLDGRVTQNTANISNLMGTTVDSVQYDTSAHDTVTLGGAGSTTPVKLTNVAPGTVSASSTDAVNGAQLYTTNTGVSNLAGDVTALQGNVTDINGRLANAVSYDTSAHDTVTLGGPGSTTPVKLTNVASGTVSASSTDAVNGAQLYTTNTGVSNLAGDVTALQGNVANINGRLANAVSYDTSAHDTVTLGGAGSTTPVKLTNVAPGTVSASSTDAVNGMQLYGVARSTASALGGGSTVNADGTMQAPAYAIGGSTFNNVGDSLTNLDGRVTQNTANISNLMGKTVDSVQYDTSAHDTVTLGGTGSTMPVRLANVAVGVVSAMSSDAMNGSQLYGTATSVATVFGGGATVDANGKIAGAVFTVDGKQYSTVEKAIQAAADSGATDLGAVRYDPNPDGTTNYGLVTLGGVAAASPVVLTNVADGVNRYDAVNFGQLSGLADKVTNIDARVARIENHPNAGGEPYFDSTGADQARPSTEASGDPPAGKLADAGTGTGNVAAGAGASVANEASNAAAIGANATVAANNGVAIGAGSSSTGEASVAIGQGAAASGNNAVALGAGSVAAEDNTVSVGSANQTRRMTNVADGVNASDAATKGQLDRAMGGMQGQINDVARRAYSGIAAATALTMIPSVDQGKTISVGIGAATYKGYQAVAIGGEARVTENLKVKAGVGLSSDGNTVGMGAAYQW
ncbi:MAG TPA: YadA-like family protein [Paraburkholderia sp.]|nr:YadA-like family protein [Paraburkholderia sp.]